MAESYAMKGGDGEYGYSGNSHFQVYSSTLASVLTEFR